MDVYANIRVGKTIIPVIFEDKTDTFLHDNQESKYIEKIEKLKTGSLFNDNGLCWREKAQYVFFKTGYVFDWQREVKIWIKILMRKLKVYILMTY